MNRFPFSLFLLLIFLAGAVTAPEGRCAVVVPEPAPDNDALTLVPLPASSAAVASVSAVSDVHRLLVVGVAGGELLVYRLTATGELENRPAETIKLPRSGPVKAEECQPTSLLFHPQLPLLYVWLDVLDGETSQPTGEKFPHLSIYRVQGQSLQFVSSSSAGESLESDRWQQGSLALDRDQKRLFTPNILRAPNSAMKGPAYYDLNAQSLPLTANGQPAPWQSFARTFIDTGDSIVPGPEGTLLIGTNGGAYFFDTGKGQLLQLRIVPETSILFELAPHPGRPICYFTGIRSGIFFAMEELGGHLTQMPKIVRLQGVTFQTPPIVMAERNAVAVGATKGTVVIFDLDKEGWPTGKATEHKVEGMDRSVLRMAYSGKFNRLYVPSH